MPMKGIEFIVENGVRKAVVDLEEFGELWEDFYDAAVARERESEPRETLDEVMDRLGLKDA